MPGHHPQYHRYNLLFIVLQTVMAIAIALFLNEVKSKFWNRFFQTSVLLPYLFSYVIASYLVYAFLSPTTVCSIIFSQ